MARPAVAAYHGYGTVFELTPTGGGDWSEKLVQSLAEAHMGFPQASLIRDAAGNLYGTTASGGIYDLGTVFELTPNNDGGWTELVLHHFGLGRDGADPTAGLIWDAAGNLYGTTSTGGVITMARCSSSRQTGTVAGRRTGCMTSTTAAARTGRSPKSA